jgi:molybdopterin molybdotransferase
MITFEEAHELVCNDLLVNPIEKIPLNETLGRVLAADVQSDMDMPPFDKAAVDGYACRRVDLSEPLQLLEVIGAGQQPKQEIGAGHCSKIMTGAPIPAGSDCVVMVEQTESSDGTTVRVLDIKTKNNIAFKGEDIKKGETVIPKGVLIQPQHMAVLAAVGAVDVPVYEKVKLCILSTGDELVEPGTMPGPGQIRNSNATQLIMQARRMGVDARYGGIVADTEDACRSMIGEAVAKNQVVVLSGGISMGDFDYVPAILKELGLTIRFKSIAVQPGRPSVFASSGNKFVFALPGNPVSSFNIFELLAKPFLYKLMGHDHRPPRLLLPLEEDYSRRNAGRQGYVPAFITNHGTVKLISYHGSAHINALVFATALAIIPLHVSSINKGELVDVRLI